MHCSGETLSTLRRLTRLGGRAARDIYARVRNADSLRMHFQP